MPNKNTTATFHGFFAPNYTQVPDELFDDLMTDLSGAELKVLLYIIRRTFGFKKTEDTISLSQMLNGITTKAGEVLDRGTGLSKKTLLMALNTLEAKNIILTERRRSAERGNEPTAYKLNIVSNSSSNNPDRTPGVKNTPPLGVKSIPSPRGKNSPIQETVLQQTVLQIRNSKSKLQRKISNEKQGYQNFQAIGDLLKQQPVPQKREVHHLPESIEASIDEITDAFNDAGNRRSNRTHVLHIYQVSGQSKERFTSSLYEARSITKQQGSIRKTMPYFFRVLEDITGVNRRVGDTFSDAPTTPQNALQQKKSSETGNLHTPSQIATS
jgi:hypothetical protein